MKNLKTGMPVIIQDVLALEIPELVEGEKGFVNNVLVIEGVDYIFFHSSVAGKIIVATEKHFAFDDETAQEMIDAEEEV